MSPVDLRGRIPSGENAPAPRPVLWKCPACGAEQSGRFELGCNACGSGRPGVHGEPPPVRTHKAANDLDSSAAQPEPAAGAPGGAPDLDESFVAWIRPLRGKLDSETESILYEAFKAGWFGALARVQPSAGPPLTGTAETRTLAAALRFFAENVLTPEPEEVRTGEWLSREEVERLAQKLERTI